MITVEELKESVVYKDGRLFWKEDRPVSHFNCNRGYTTWKTNYAGRPVGTLRDDGYIRFGISIRGVTVDILEHVAILTLELGYSPEMLVDHINGDRADNRRDNLRLVDECGNTKNNAKRSDNTSGVTGVCWDKQTGKWRVQGRSNYLPFRPTRFSDKFEAICARKSWEIKEEFSARHGTRKEGLQ